MFMFLCSYKFQISFLSLNLISNMGGNTWVHESNSRNLSVYLSLTQLAKTLCLPYYAYVISSTKLVIRAEENLPGSEGRRWGGWERRTGWRNDPNNVCTCE
jgi:hypothetical protein